MIHTFDHTIKPILHYSAEVWDTFETELKNGRVDHKKPCIEKLNVKFCKYLLCINKKASNSAVIGELGIYIDSRQYCLQQHKQCQGNVSEL